MRRVPTRDDQTIPAARDELDPWKDKLGAVTPPGVEGKLEALVRERGENPEVRQHDERGNRQSKGHPLGEGHAPL